jgi:uncharacterized protein (DUF362 family)
MNPKRDPQSFVLGRRRFGQLVAGGMLSAALPGARSGSADAQVESAGGQPLPTVLRHFGAAASPVTLSAVARGAGDEAVERAVRRAALSATDFSWLSRGDTVLVKPVCNSGNVYPATTDPVALRAMIGLLREKGAGRVIVGEMSGVQSVRFTPDHLRGSTRELMISSGLARAAEDAGAQLVAFEEQGWDAFFEDPVGMGGSWQGGVMLPKVLEEVDHVVLMPRCARHLLAGSTLGLKAAVGWWRHDSRLEYHRAASTFSQKTADANTARTLLAKQRLVLSSATKVLTTFGPDQGWVEEPETGLVIASPSVVAHDMVSLAWLNENRRATPERKRDSVIDDPNRSQLVVSLANRVVCNFLGGFAQFFEAERLERYEIDTIWDDRVLLRAFEAFGGVPRVELVDADGAVPRALRERFSAEVALPT